MEITETHLNAIQEVAAALRMTVNDFLNEDITGITLEQARKYLKAFASSADDSKILAQSDLYGGLEYHHGQMYRDSVWFILRGIAPAKKMVDIPIIISHLLAPDQFHCHLR